MREHCSSSHPLLYFYGVVLSSPGLRRGVEGTKNGGRRRSRDLEKGGYWCGGGGTAEEVYWNHTRRTRILERPSSVSRVRLQEDMLAERLDLVTKEIVRRSSGSADRCAVRSGR